MLAFAEIGIWHWTGFLVAVLVFLALDLGVFHRSAHVVKFKEALAWTVIWFFLAMGFAFFIAPAIIGASWTPTDRVEFITGYILELSLSMDNVFVIALIFSFFRVPPELQHRVLFWGILGALVMRGAMIGVGAALVKQFGWILHIFGGFLVFTGFKMLMAREDEEVHPEKNPVIRLARRFFPISARMDGQKFVTVENGRRALTPLALVLIMVETTDLIFAVDSIPAIFAVTRNVFIIFTSNVFAILGLRSLYFVLAGAIGCFRYLKIGLSVVLIYIGIKMLLMIWHIEIPIGLSLGVVIGIIATSILASLIAAAREKRTPPAAGL